jgi:hypothetical protein
VIRNRFEDAGSEQLHRARKQMVDMIFSVSVSVFALDSVKQGHLKSLTLLNGSRSA